MSFLGIAPIGALLSGWIGEHWGPPIALAGCGVGALLAAGAYWRQLPAIRREIRPVYRSLGIMPKEPQ
jgi:hypothetical protein